MGDQHGARLSGRDRRGRVPDMQEERGAADPVPSIQRGMMPSAWATWTGPGRAYRRDPVDVLERQARVGDRVHRRLEMQAEAWKCRAACRARWSPRPRDDGPACSCGLPGWREQRQAQLAAPLEGHPQRHVKHQVLLACSGRPTRLVIIRGPSASWTTAIAYGASSSNPGAGRWLITYEYSVASPLAVNHSTRAEPQAGRPDAGKSTACAQSRQRWIRSSPPRSRPRTARSRASGPVPACLPVIAPPGPAPA